MKLAAFRLLRIRKMTLGVLTTIWLALALHPCAMAYGQADTPATMPEHNCPHCPPPAETSDCELVDWQQTDFASNAASGGIDNTHSPFTMPLLVVALAFWQPVQLGTPPPPDPSGIAERDLPLTLQDQLRL